MADEKVSGLPPTTSIMATDQLILVQNGVTKRIEIEDFFGSGIPVELNVAGSIVYGATPDSVTSGAVSLAVVRTNLNLQGSNTVTIANGIDGQVKLIVATSSVGGVTSLTGSLFANSIQFTKQGDSATLLFTGGKWAQIGGTAVAQ